MRADQADARAQRQAPAAGGAVRLRGEVGRDPHRRDCDHGHIDLAGATARLHPALPEVRELARSLGARRLVLDGEVVAFDEQGRPSFERLQARMHLASDSAVRRRMRDIPATYVIFDLLYLGQPLTMALSYEERRSLLEQLELEGPAWRTPAYRGGSALLEATKSSASRGWWRRSSTAPQPGARASHWIKVKNVHTQDVVIGGWTPGEGSRPKPRLARRGGHEGEQLVYAGKVGTGFTEQTLALLKRELEPLRRDDARSGPPASRARSSWSRGSSRTSSSASGRGGTLRAPSFKGLRPDVSPQECVREEVEAPAGG